MTTVEKSSASNGANRLIHEKSPYLLQHAHNPVDWYPWGPEAFDRAQKEDRPIFLSVGYSTCHWCHVMAHESFEDHEVARQLNEVFVNIKLDREERPDIDQIYMTVCQMMTGGGGWPLTILMTPDKQPFFAGTYIPKWSRFGRVGMLDLIPRIRELWDARREDFYRAARQITAGLERVGQQLPGEALDSTILTKAYRQLSRQFDPTNGGFGHAPKFPTPHQLLFLLRYWNRTGEGEALSMVKRTLRAMRRGGIFDQLGFGFHRYSTDSRWRVPHFEKMLYDQALLAMAYIETFQASGRPDFAESAHQIFTYVLREMTATEGGFYSAEDADSEGEEGKFYLWSEQEIRQVLSVEEADLVVNLFGVDERGNFAEEGTGQRNGDNILHQRLSVAAMAGESGQNKQELKRQLQGAMNKLFEHRNKRPHPSKDDKILTDWNGLMIAALAKGAQVFGDRRYSEAASRAAGSVLSKMRDGDGRLLHRYRDGQAAVAGMLDDYAYFIWGLLELYEATFDAGLLQTAVELNGQLLEHFWDERNGAFFSTADDGERLLVRQKTIQDGPMPSGNAVAMLNLLRLARITGRTELEERAQKLARIFSAEVKAGPAAFTGLMLALDFAIGPSHEIVIAGVPQAEDTRAMLRALSETYLPGKVVLLRPTNEAAPQICSIAPFTSDLSGFDGKATAYVCQDFHCQLPTSDVEAMLEQIG